MSICCSGLFSSFCDSRILKSFTAVENSHIRHVETDELRFTYYLCHLTWMELLAHNSKRRTVNGLILNYL